MDHNLHNYCHSHTFLLYIWYSYSILSLTHYRFRNSDNYFHLHNFLLHMQYNLLLTYLTPSRLDNFHSLLLEKNSDMFQEGTGYK